MILSIIGFIVSLCGIVFLFAIKDRELKSQRVFVPRIRARIDVLAMSIKSHLSHSERYIVALVPLLHKIFRWCVHEFAILMARFARALERESHKLADRVSHKHSFHRKDHPSDFLRRVGEYNKVR